MASINVRSYPSRVTHEGAPAKRITPEQELRRSVMACMLWEDTFYEDGVSIAQRIADLVPNVKPETVAQIASEARNKMYLRHVPLLLARELARNGYPVADLLSDIIQRPDELTEFVAIYSLDGKQPLSAQVKKGLARAFPKFNEYQLAKYDRKGAVTLRTVMFLTHPKPKDQEQAEVFKRLANRELHTPDTWEVSLSSGADKKESWTRLLAERKLGGLALLRNLRNMIQADVDERLIREAMADNKFSRVLPFRFFAAAKHAPQLEDAIEKAMLKSLAEMDKLTGKTALILDNSGSMYAALSSRSDLDRTDAAGALAVMLREVCEDVVIIGFGSDAAILPPRHGFALAEAYQKGPGGCTNTETAKQLADKSGYDRIIILSDEQSHQAISNPRGKGYVVNIASYQHGIGYGQWTHIDGWSEAIVDYIREAERVEQ